MIENVPRHYENALLAWLDAQRIQRPQLAQTVFAIMPAGDPGAGRKFIFDPKYTADELQQFIDAWDPPPDF